MATDEHCGEPVFSYRVNKAGHIAIAWHGRVVTRLKGKAALRFLSKVSSLDDRGAQLAMAKATGNFKRGNERS